jgi:transcriptional regulator with XRE-family HTH domain
MERRGDHTPRLRRLGTVVSQERKRQELSLRQVAAATGGLTTHFTVRRIEQGEDVRFSYILGVLDVIGMPLEQAVEAMKVANTDNADTPEEPAPP